MGTLQQKDMVSVIVLATLWEPKTNNNYIVRTLKTLLSKRKSPQSIKLMTVGMMDWTTGLFLNYFLDHFMDRFFTQIPSIVRGGVGPLFCQIIGGIVFYFCWCGGVIS